MVNTRNIRSTIMEMAKNPGFRRKKLSSFFKILLLFVYSSLGLVGFFVEDGKFFQQLGFLSLPLPQDDHQVDLGAFPIEIPTVKYGFVVDTFQVTEGTIQNGQFLADLLLERKVEYPNIDQLVRNAEGIFDIRHLRVGKPYTFLATDSTQAPQYFIYEPSIYEYVVFELKGDLAVKKVKKPITRETKTVEGTIESSLWKTMTDRGLSFDLAARMEDALQWSLDFHHLQKGDRFKLIYDQEYIEGEAVGIGDLYAAYYKNIDKEFFAIYYEGKEEKGFFNLDGKPMKKAFLKAPVKYSRISSYYNLRRYHPILKRRRPHLGTDYAAPYGTPIYAVGNGVVTKAAYTKGNGNFVKIKHDDTYETQYLHMQKFASGIRPGMHVEQGDVIGYVGATGLATGPHVCFRFWKDGRQINHLKLTFPASKPLPEQELPDYFRKRDDYLAMMGFEDYLSTKPDSFRLDRIKGGVISGTADAP